MSQKCHKRKWAVELIALIGPHAYICCNGSFPGGISKKMIRRPTLGLSVDQLWKMAVYTITQLSDVFSGGPQPCTNLQKPTEHSLLSVQSISPDFSPYA